MPYKFNPFTKKLDLVGTSGGGGTVKSVNGILPDGAGNVTVATGIVTQNITVAGLQTLIAAGTVVPGTVYNITNPQQGGTILAIGASANQISTDATWLRPTLLYAFGWLRIAGVAGSVDSITVNGATITTASIPFTTSLANTAVLVVENINANTGSSGFRAVAIGDAIVVISTNAPSAAINGQVVSGTATTLTFTNNQNLTNGVASTIQNLPIYYDISADRIRKAFDPVRNISIELSERYRALFVSDPFNDFRWGESVYSSIYLKDTQVSNNYAVTGTEIRNINSNGASFSSNLLSGTRIYNILLQSRNATVTGFAYFTNNMVLGTSSFIESCDIEIGVNGNILTGSSTFIRGVYQFCYSSNASLNIGVCNNILSGASVGISGVNQQYNIGGGTFGVNSNTLSGTSSIIAGITQVGYGAVTLSSNILSTSFQQIINIQQFGRDCKVSSNTLSSATTNIGIAGCVLIGRASSINSNILSAGSGISACTLIGVSSGINSNNFGGIAASISGIILSANGALISGYTFDATMTTISDIEWTADNTISMTLASGTLSGAANAGLAGSPINIGILPVAKGYVLTSVFEGNGLVGVGATLQAALETDTTCTLTPALTIARANDINFVSGATSNKSTAANRKIQITPLVANVTAGSFQMFVQFKISKY